MKLKTRMALEPKLQMTVLSIYHCILYPFIKLVPSAIPIHSYLYWIDIELMNKWHWTSPRQIKVEKTVIYSFSLFENAQHQHQYLSVSECLYVCLLSSVFMCFCVSSFHV